MALLKHIQKVKGLEIKDQFNYISGDVIYLSTKEFTRDEVEEARSVLNNDYHIMNCHSFKSMRLEPLDINSETRKAFPIPSDVVNNKI
jgi:hypothetical protein